MKNAVLITGALGGIGRALCEAFTESGYHVIGTDQAEGSLPSGVLVRADLRRIVSDDGVRAAFHSSVNDALAGNTLTALVNNAAVQLLGSTDEITLDDWRQTLDTNLIAPFVLAQLFLAQLSKARGSVINIASIHATATKPRFVCYATSKAALVGLTRSMAVDLGPRLRVNAILPAAVSTPMLTAGFADRLDLLAALGHAHPLERIAHPSEVARTAVFLASDAAAFISGSSLEVSGGIAGRLHDPI